MEEPLFDGVANESAIVDFFPFPYSLRDHVTGSEVFIAILFVCDRAIYWACAGKNYYV